MEENEKKELALQIIDRLKKAYPDADCTLDYDDAGSPVHGCQSERGGGRTL